VDKGSLAAYDDAQAEEKVKLLNNDEENNKSE